MSSAFATALSGRIRQLHLQVTADALAHLETYYQLLVRWNRTTNLTSLPVETLAPAALDRMLLEPLSAAADFPDVPVSWIDLGSGGGSPAIPLRVVRPHARLVMVEAKAKKAAFLREVVRALALDDVAVAAERFEALASDAQFVNGADLVTARAVRADAVFVDTVSRLLHSGGRLLLFESEGAPVLDAESLALVGRRPLLAGTKAQLSTYFKR